MELLPGQTRSKLRSSTILTSLPQLVVELVQNSLDASASLIEIGVDMGNWSIWVRDNGVGIARQDIEKLCVGLEERRYGM
jgi:DNA mismatch repair protein MLH3